MPSWAIKKKTGMFVIIVCNTMHGRLERALYALSLRRKTSALNSSFVRTNTLKCSFIHPHKNTNKLLYNIICLGLRNNRPHRFRKPCTRRQYITPMSEFGIRREMRFGLPSHYLEQTEWGICEHGTFTYEIIWVKAVSFWNIVCISPMTGSRREKSKTLRFSKTLMNVERPPWIITWIAQKHLHNFLSKIHPHKYRFPNRPWTALANTISTNRLRLWHRPVTLTCGINLWH